MFRLDKVLKNVVKQVDVLGHLSIPDLLKRPPALSTDFQDAFQDFPILDQVNPQDSSYVRLTSKDLSPAKSFLLNRGTFYVFNAESYCVRTGAHAPGEGDGYVAVPFKGAQTDSIKSIVVRASDHPEIEQQDIQLLLWAIIANTKVSEMGSRLQQVARMLLTPKQIFQLDGGALGLIPDEILQLLMQKVPKEVYQVFEVGNRLRSLFASAKYTYAEVEKVAVLAGHSKPLPGVRAIPRGRWSYHPDGYFVRYFPSGFSRTRIEMYAPQPMQVGYDDQGRVVHVLDEEGTGVVSTYDDSIPPIPHPKLLGISAHAFKTIRVLSRGEVVYELSNVGWAFQDPPASGVASPMERFPDFDHLAEVSEKISETIEVTVNIVEAAGKPNKESAKDLADVQFWCDGLLAGVGGRLATVGAYAVILITTYKAMLAICEQMRGGAESPKEDVQADPSNVAAMPATTGQSILAALRELLGF